VPAGAFGAGRAVGADLDGGIDLLHRGGELEEVARVVVGTDGGIYVGLIADLPVLDAVLLLYVGVADPGDRGLDEALLRDGAAGREERVVADDEGGFRADALAEAHEVVEVEAPNLPFLGIGVDEHFLAPPAGAAGERRPRAVEGRHGPEVVVGLVAAREAE